MPGDCTFAEDRRRPAFEARVLFSTACDPSILTVEAEPALGPRVDFSLACFAELAHLCVGADGQERVLLSDGVSHIRFDVRSGTVRAGPVRLRLVVDCFDHVARIARASERLAESIQHGILARRPLLGPDRARRWHEALIAWDARAQGASQRDIAGFLVGVDRARAEWGGASDSLRAKVRRLLDHADAMVAGDWRSLLALDP